MNPPPLADVDQLVDVREGPGSRLRQARLAKGLELSRVASELHLSEAMIEAIELDDYVSLPGPVFVRGYIKNYARMLGLDSASLVGAYSRSLPVDGGVPPLRHEPRIKTEIASSHLVVRLVTWLIIIMVVVLLVNWWQSKMGWPNLPGMIRGSDGGNTDSIPTSIRDSEEIRLLPTEKLTKTDTPDDMLDDTGVSPSLQDQPRKIDLRENTIEFPPETGIPAVSVRDEANLPVTAPSVPETSPSSPPEKAEVAEISTLPATAQTPVDTAQVKTERPEIEFSFTESCWLDARDASGKNKIRGTMAKGTRRQLPGKPPFTVVLGNASAAQVKVGGRPFDLSRYSRGNVARFKIVSADLNR